MAYPVATNDHIRHFADHGFVIVDDAIDPADLADLELACTEIIEHKEQMAFDWAWSADEARDERSFRILQASPTMVWPERFADAPFRRWAVAFASALMGRPMEFWYDQFLAKPPGYGAETRWHQDEGYWGRNLDDLGCTAWMPFHDVGIDDGCMHFIDASHRDGVLEHHRPPEVQSDLLYCEPDESRAIACPVRLGTVTFHHSKTAHMTTPNTGASWRRVLTQHLRVEDGPGEGDHYPWKIWVNQFNGRIVVPSSR